MKRAFGYLRVSKDPKLEKISPEVQRRMVKEACQKRRWELVNIYEDVDVPSKKIDSVGTWEALESAIKAGHVVVTIEYTRIGRNLREMLARIDALQKAGAELVSLEQELDTTTAAGKLQLHVLLVLAEFERDRLSERLRHTHQQIASEGRWKGGGTPPLGYSYSPGAKVLEVDPEEAAIVREIYQLRDSGLSVNSIIREMDRRGARGKRGARLDYSAVTQTLRNPTYIGKRVHRGEVHEGRHEPIIDEDLWERVQARRRQGTSKQTRYLASGLLVCGTCGSRMIHQTSSSNGQRRGFYVCNRARQFRDTPMVTIADHLVHAWLTDALFARLDGKKMLALKDRARKKAPKTKDRIAKVEAQLSRVEASLGRLVADYYDVERPLLTPEQFRKKNAELLEKKIALERERQQLEDDARLDNVVNLSERRAREIRETWDGMSLDEQREVLRLFVEKVRIMPRKGPKKYQPGRVRVTWR